MNPELAPTILLLPQFGEEILQVICPQKQGIRELVQEMCDGIQDASILPARRAAAGCASEINTTL